MEKRKKFDAFTIHSLQEPSLASVPVSALVSPLPESENLNTNVHPVKWSWACRHVDQSDWGRRYHLSLDSSQVRPGDVALVTVEKTSYHHYLEVDKGRRLRLYEGDKLVCVFGDRYATDVYEGRVLDPQNNELHMLTGSGLIGTVTLRHRGVKRPTALSLLGLLTDSSGSPINLKKLRFGHSSERARAAKVIVVAGTGMNSGKTTIMRKILHGMVCRGASVAGCKLTGSASPRDLYELRSTGAMFTTDFSDYGFPSTYGATIEELIRLFDHMVYDSCSKGAEVIVMEVADGFLQRETRMLLDSEEFVRRTTGVIVAGTCSGSALCATEYMQRAGFDVWGISGLITNSPLFVREFSGHSPVPVASSGSGEQLIDIVMRKLRIRETEASPLEIAVQGMS